MKTHTACLVHDLQPSDTPCLPINQEPTSLQQSVPLTLSLYHPQEAFDLKLRTYIYNIYTALACKMDLQLDGKVERCVFQ